MKKSIDILSQLEPEIKRENHSHSHPTPRVSLANERHQAKEEVSPYLQIASAPIKERIDPKEVRYILVILPDGIRAAGGQFLAEEAHAIANAVKGWDWSLDENQRPFCLPALEALLDSICKRSALKGGEG